jgi:hypothetical protein
MSMAKGLTRAYVQLRDGLEKLSGVRTVYVPLDALVIGSGDDFQWNPDSIINVDTLNHLGKDAAAPLRVVPVADGRLLPEAAVARSLLATLTAELTFVLSDAPVAALLEHVDLLDFPGYRGRLRVTSLGEVRAQLREDADPVVQLLLRGKVAYLFERYTDDQEMSMLIMVHALRSSDRDRRPGAGARYLGARDAGEHAGRTGGAPTLAWVLTQFDHRLTPKPNLTESQQRTELNTMIKVTLLTASPSANGWASGPRASRSTTSSWSASPASCRAYSKRPVMSRAPTCPNTPTGWRGRARCSSMRTTSSATSPTPARRGTRCSSRTTAAWNAWPPISTRRSTSAPSWRASPSRCSA